MLMINIACFFIGMIFMLVFITKATDIVVIRGKKDSVQLVSYKEHIYKLVPLNEPSGENNGN